MKYKRFKQSGEKPAYGSQEQKPEAGYCFSYTETRSNFKNKGLSFGKVIKNVKGGTI